MLVDAGTLNRKLLVSMDSSVQQWSKRKVNPFRLASLQEVVGDSLLDVGCGNGAYVDYFSQDSRAVGMDVRPYRAWRDQSGEYMVGSIESIPIPDNAFDSVSCFEVLEHLRDPRRALAELVRVCKRNLILSVPNCELTQGLEDSRLAYFHYTDASHVQFFTPDRFKDLVESAGLRIRSQSLINPIDPLPFIMEAMGGPRWLWRAIRRIRRPADHCMTILVSAEKA